MSIGRIWGGSAVNIVPDKCTIEIDRRLVPGEAAAGALTEIDAVLAGVRGADAAVTIQREALFLTDWPLDTPPDADG